MKDKKWFENAWILALVILGLSALANLVFLLIFGHVSSIVELCTLIFSAQIVGSLYANRKNELMPRILKIKVAFIDALIQLIFVVLCSPIYLAGKPHIITSAYFIMFGVIIVISILSGLIVYFGLGFGMKKYIPHLKSTSAKKK